MKKSAVYFGVILFILFGCSTEPMDTSKIDKYKSGDTVFAQGTLSPVRIVIVRKFDKEQIAEIKYLSDGEVVYKSYEDINHYLPEKY